MSQKVVLIAGLIGLTFGFLFSATLGINFFEEDNPNNIMNNLPMNNNDDDVIDDNNNDDDMMVVDDDTTVDDDTDTMDTFDSTPTVDPEVEQFRLDYNLSESIYIPVSGLEVFQMIENDETFIVFAGRKGCPYCQQFVPVLQSAAQSLGVDTIYYIDITIGANDAYLDDAGFEYPNSTFIYINGVLEDNIRGFVNETNTTSILSNYFGN